MATSEHILEPDAQVIFLLCGRFGSRDDSSVKPLTQNQYNKVANWLNRNEMRPADLLTDSGRDRLAEFGDEGKLTEDRLRTLLRRGTSLALAVEEWTNTGGWILARSDPDYPKRFKRRLRHEAPPILYGVGDKGLLEFGGMSMVGSRDADDAALAFVSDLAQRCAEEGIQVVSGGARGVDRTSMEAALDVGGYVVGALANGLSKTARKKKYREPIMEGRLTLVSAYHPDSRFAVWKAMGRNKHIYALSDGALVAHSSAGSGGTWSGATENMEHGWVPLFVRAELPIPEGNRRLIEMGGMPVDRRLFHEDIDLKTWLSEPVVLSNVKPAADRLTSTLENGKHESPEREADVHPNREQYAPVKSVREYLEECRTEGKQPEIFPFVWPLIRTLLDEPRSAKDVREFFDDLHLGQARDWLMMAVEQGKIERSERPVRYSLPKDKIETEEESSLNESEDKEPLEPKRGGAQPRDLFSDA